MKNLIIGTRASKLALWQAEHVKTLLKEKFPLLIQIKKITTKGDQILDRSLVEIGGKALFLKEIEDELLSGTVDIAVHSMKDVPYDLPQGLVISCMLEREDPRDVFVGAHHHKIADLPTGAVIGTTSLRRLVQIQKKHPKLQFKDIRGNVDTRLKKLSQGEFDGIILAAAGLKRLGLEQHVNEYLDIVPACGQGAIGVECRHDNKEILKMLRSLNHETTFQEVSLERYFLKKVGGNCQTPVGAHVKTDQKDSHRFKMQCFLAVSKDEKSFQHEIGGKWDDGFRLVDLIDTRLCDGQS